MFVVPSYLLNQFYAYILTVISIKRLGPEQTAPMTKNKPVLQSTISIDVTFILSNIEDHGAILIKNQNLESQFIFTSNIQKLNYT